MFRYFLVLTIAGIVIYASQRPEILGLGLSDPSFKVWVDQPFSHGLDRNIVVLNVQSREDKPIIVRGVLANDDPKCVNTNQPQSFEQPMKLGQVLRFTLGIRDLGACDPVKVVISTDRGDSVYRFNQ
jgi:hypothetical protein